MDLCSIDLVVFTFLCCCINYPKDINQLVKIIALTGTPGPTLIAKMTSDEVFLVIVLITTTVRYGDVVDNTVEENSSIFSLIQV